VNGFVICSKFTQQSAKLLDDCISSIQKFHPDSTVVLVDSDSDDKSYLSAISARGILIEDVQNRGYEAGAWVYAFEKYKREFTNFMFMQDSQSLIAPVPFDLLSDKNSCIKFSDNRYSWQNDPECYRWAQENSSNNSFKTDITSIIEGNTFSISSEVMQRVVSSSCFCDHKLPDCKLGSRAWERLWQSTFELLELDILIQLNVISKQFLDRK